MQMHDYARKPRGRKVFSGRREGEAESREAGKRGRGEEKRRRRRRRTKRWSRKETR